MENSRFRCEPAELRRGVLPSCVNIICIYSIWGLGEMIGGFQSYMRCLRSGETIIYSLGHEVRGKRYSKEMNRPIRKEERKPRT
jgi:hypothetical protein